MKKPAIPFNEINRLLKLKSYQILDTPNEVIFDNLTNLASSIFQVPIALVSLVDEKRQWFKSSIGLSVCETKREYAFCAHAINQKEAFIVNDARKDQRFSDNPLVIDSPNVVFYAGIPLIDSEGFALGTLCIIDHRPRRFSKEKISQLELLAKQVVYSIESRLFEKEKEKTYSLLTKLSESLPGVIYTYQVYPDGRSCFPYASKHIQQIYGVRPDEVKDDAQIVYSRLHPEDNARILATIQHSAESLSRWICDYRVILPNSGERWVRGNANPEKQEDGSIIWHGYIDDITEFKNQERIIIQSSKMVSLGEMSAGIAHEVNNPLSIIKMAAMQMKNQIDRNELDIQKLSKQAEKINTTIDRVTKIIKGLSYFSKNSSHLDLKNEKVKTLIDETIALCQERLKINGVALKYKYPKNFDDLFFECRLVEVSQVLLNLLNNAFDAIENLEEKWIEIEIVDLGANLQFRVTDSGRGISRDLATLILTPFFTTKTAGKGTGLGLSISQKIIHSHSGNFWIDTESNNTCFIFELPKNQIELKQIA